MHPLGKSFELAQPRAGRGETPRRLDLAVERVGQPGLHAPSVGVHLDQSAGLGPLHGVRVDQHHQQWYAQRLAEGEHLQYVTLSLRQLAYPS